MTSRAVRVAVVDLHRQVQLLGERDVITERLTLQFTRRTAGAEEVHAGLADGHHLLGVGDGQPVHLGERLFKRHVVVRLVLELQSVRSGHAAVPVQHRLVGVDGQSRVHHTRMVQRHLHGRHQVRQLATGVDDAFDADGCGLVEQLVDAVDGNRRLPLHLRLVAHRLGEGDDGGDMRMVVDGPGVFGQRLGGRCPAAVAVMLAHGSPV